MRMLALIGAALALAGSAAAANVRPAEFRDHGRHVTRHMRAQDYNHFDYGIARPTYPSGWGGPYNDGQYPGTVDQNMGPSRW